MVGAWGNEDLIEGAFSLEEYAADSRLEVGSLRISFQEVPHFQETFAIKVESADGARLVFGADSGPTDCLVEFAAEADLLLVEATLPRPERTGKRGHLTPREAGEHGRAAGARRLVLTHMSDELDSLWVRNQAREGFRAPVELAEEGAVYIL